MVRSRVTLFNDRSTGLFTREVRVWAATGGKSTDDTALMYEAGERIVGSATCSIIRVDGKLLAA